MRMARGIMLALLALSLGGALAGCDSLETFQFWDTKKKLPGDRQPVFPGGVPGVEQGIPPELMKGYQEQQSADPAAVAAQESAEKAQPKKPAAKKTKVAQPRPARPAPAPEQQASPPPQPAAQQQQAQPPAWPGSQPQAQQGAPWPTAR